LCKYKAENILSIGTGLEVIAADIDTLAKKFEEILKKYSQIIFFLKKHYEVEAGRHPFHHLEGV
jgi:hypothetical protein